MLCYGGNNSTKPFPSLGLKGDMESQHQGTRYLRVCMTGAVGFAIRVLSSLSNLAGRGQGK